MRSFGAIIHAGEGADEAQLRGLLERRHPALTQEPYVLTVNRAEYRRDGHVRYHVSVRVEALPDPPAARAEPVLRVVTLPLALRPPLGPDELDTLVPAALARACPEVYWPAEEIDSTHDGATLQLRLALPQQAGEAPIDELTFIRTLRAGIDRMRGGRYPER